MERYTTYINNYTKPQNLGSLATWDKIRHWLHVCLEFHEYCRIMTPVLPKRVLDVSVQKDSRDVRLCEMQSTGQYVTLSHCWGTGTKCLPPLRTLKENIRERLLCIKWDHLSKVFQDAISVCRDLGFRYLWIDSLCIIQDDPNDWKEQAGKMHEIYEQSHLTIAATGARHGDDGLFLTVQKMLYDEVIVQEVPDRSIWEADNGVWYPSCPGQPLNSRAWCLQERLLATRILHYSTTEIAWECKTCVNSGCEEERNIRGGFKQNFPHNSSWQLIVARYTYTQLTFDADVLPALSGIAARMSRIRKSQYLAGLWESDLPGALLWYSSGPSRRPSSYTAPSFSWASRVGPVQFRDPHADESDLLVTVVEAFCNTDNISPFGAVTGGFIKCRGRTIAVSVEVNRVDSFPDIYIDASLPTIQRIAIEVTGFSWDTHKDASSNTPQRLHFLPVRSSGRFVSAIVLRDTQTANETYSRVGIVWWKVDVALFVDTISKSIPEQIITIV